MLRNLFFLYSLVSNLLFAQVEPLDQIRCDVQFKNNICAEINWTYGPFFDKYSSAVLLLNQARQIKVIPWMVMDKHEHGSRPVKLITLNPTEFKIDEMFFMGGMTGRWFLKIQLLDNKKNVIDEARYPVAIK